MLNKHKSNKQNLWKVCLIIPFLAIFLWSFNVYDKVNYQVIPQLQTTQPPVSELPVNTPKSQTSTLESKENSEGRAVTIDKHAQGVSSLAVSGVRRQGTAIPSEKNMPTHIVLSETTIKEIRKLIHNRITEPELKVLQAELKRDHNIVLTWSNLSYNSNGVLTSLNISISSDYGNGNFSVQDDEGVEDIYIYFDPEAEKIGFWSEGIEERKAERETLRRERTEMRIVEREEMEEERKARRMEMQERREEIRVRRDEMREVERERERELAEREVELQELQRERAELIKVRVNRERDRNQGLHLEHNSLRINKNTTDAELERLKQELKEAGITFSYKRVKRNDRGEITDIRINMDDGKGNKSSRVVSSDDDQGIKDLIIRI